MKVTSSVSTLCLLPTRNRPDFVLRSLKSVLRHEEVFVVILDSSTPNASARLVRQLRFNPGIRARVDLRCFRPNIPVTERFVSGLAGSTESLVYLASDDDLTLDGFGVARETIVQDTSIVAAYGSTLRFSLRQGFVPVGTIAGIRLQHPVPRIPWQDDFSVQERLRETAKGPLSSHGWYAIHRRESLERIVQASLATGQGDEVIEFALCLLQPILGRVHCVREPFLARQDEDRSRTAQRIGARKYLAQRKAIMRIAQEALVSDYGVTPWDSVSLVGDAVRRDMLFANQFELSATRIGAAIKALLEFAAPSLAGRVQSLRSRRAGVSTHVDERLPVPSKTQVAEAVRLVNEFVAG